jgi:Flp pilus assembly protein TadB
VLAWTLAAAIVVVCCAGPALLAAGVLGPVSAMLGNPWVLAVAVLLAVGATGFAVHARRHRSCTRTDHPMPPGGR